MKKLFLLIAAIALFAFAAKNPVKVELSVEQWQFHFQNLEAVKQIVNGSSLPHNQAVFILQSIDSLQRATIPQINAQLKN